MGLFYNLKLKKQYKMVYKPFFDRAVKQLDRLSLIEDEIPEDVSLLNEKFKTNKNKKINKFSQVYDGYSNNVIVHNQNVNKILSGINSFNKSDILLSPSNYSKESLVSYFQIANLIDTFKEIDITYINYRNDAIDIYNDIENIVRQKESYDRISSLWLSIDEMDYLDFNQAKQIVDKYNELKMIIDSLDKKYYEFDKFNDLDNRIKMHNEDFIRNNLSNKIFDDINGKSLDNEQRESVLTNELSTLVVAGAGSGKTLTICGKVVYLLKEMNVNPEDILLLSYSKKSADDLQEKVSLIDNRLTVGTFHKLGLDILKDTTSKVFMVEDQYKAIIEKYFREEMKNRPKMLQTILSYYGLYISSGRHDKKYKDEGELFFDLKNMGLSTLKDQLVSLSEDITKKETLKKELVKSYEEMAIANWYYINGINYIYEAPYEIETSTYDKRQYMPDFYLPDYDIYHEHYGINRDGKALQYKDERAQVYVTNIDWKREIHKFNNTKCLETFSFEFEDGNIFEKLEKELKNNGVEFKPLTNEQIYNALQSIYEGQSFKSFINLVRTFLSLYKTNYSSVDGFDELANYKFDTMYENYRASHFLQIVKDVYLYYIDYISKEGKIDFDDMILQSTIKLDSTYNFKYKYIIVDEFQDISISRMKFLKKLIDHGNSKLFAVGDDWQAIYRFSGCDLNIFLKFNEYFGASAITKITTTHRNSQELQDIAGPFIKTNPEQFDKKINSNKHLNNPVRIMYYFNEKRSAFLDACKETSKYDPNANVLVLGRNNRDIESIEIKKRIFIDYSESSETKVVLKVFDYPDMKFTYSTVHGSKGLEEDYVIIINANDSRLGFPNKMEDDELLDMVLSSKSEFEYAEERRLWYVALTRTRSYTYILVNRGAPSIFVKEIEQKCLETDSEDNPIDDSVYCPRCKSGILVYRSSENDPKGFYGCTNYPYCNYTINDFKAVERNLRCRFCGDFMIYRKGQFGPFYGCHNYPRCRYKTDFIPNK